MTSQEWKVVHDIYDIIVKWGAQLVAIGIVGTMKKLEEIMGK
jgi:hypothetical protein